GTPTATTRTSARLSDRSLVKNGAPVKGIAAIVDRSAKNRPKPTAVPMAAARLDSTAESTEIWGGVAPTNRIAAKRCSRRAADRRVAVPMKMSTGNSNKTATTASTRATPLELKPTANAQLLPHSLGEVVLMLVTSTASGWW